MASALTCLLAVQLFLDGCAPKPPHPGVHFPITSGFHTRLPTEHQRILIWGSPLLANLVDAWLRSHHYSSIIIPPSNSSPPLNRQAVFTLAAEQDADIVLLLEQEELTERALIESRCSGGFNISITVRGLSAEGRETILRGTAYYPQCVEHSATVIQHLSCQALATAWGFRPSGQLEIPWHLACTAGQTTSIPTH